MRSWIQARAAEMTEEGLAYSVALLLFILSLLAIKPSRYFDVQLPQVFVYAAIAFLLYGFWTYLAPVMKKASESILVKGVWTGLTIAGATVAISFSQIDRKSTRLNSSHVAISYAVFCLKKKTDT